MHCRQLTDYLGVELLDFDVTSTATAEEQAELRALFCEHHLLLIRGQQPSDADQDRFAQYFGPLSLMHDAATAGYISNLGEAASLGEHSVTGQKELLWHADGTQGEHPGIGTSLLAIVAAPGCAGTKFINAVRAAEDLPSELRSRDEGQKAAHFREYDRTDRRMRAEELDSDAPPGTYPSCEHDILYRLPHTDKLALFVNELSTSHVVGMRKGEGEQLLQALFAHLYNEERAYTHEWQPGDLLIWDNIALQHCRPSLGTAARHLRRISLDGWNTGDGVLDWFAAGTLRDRAAA
jgi:alpha-ketoglutarate-dependent taurine dioxygenase